MNALVTRYGATIEVTAEEITACQEAGNAYYDNLLANATAKTEDSLQSQRRMKRRATTREQELNTLRDRRLRWNYTFDNADLNDRLWQEAVFAPVLEWGRGVATCPKCNDIYLGSSLRVEESFVGCVQQEFFCPTGHLLWITNEHLRGDIHEGMYLARPIERSGPWEAEEEIARNSRRFGWRY